MATHNPDTIAAIATPLGKGGVGVIRLSGPKAIVFGKAITGRQLPNRQAVYTKFNSQNGDLIDTGLAISFSAPKSFTGENVVELQGHGGPIIQDLILSELIQLGARQARAGEFSERAFLNDKIDLTQAEAIADLIDSSTEQAAKGAARSMQGVFSKKVADILKELVHLRMYVEAAIDFPEEEIDFLADEKVLKNISGLQDQLVTIIKQANQGTILRNGMRLVLAGKPNAGKSSLLNVLAGTDAAIVTAIPGTTRDTISQTIDIDGLAVHIVDTAGLRESMDEVEKIGVERAKMAIEDADHVLFLVDASDEVYDYPRNDKTSLVINKCDLVENIKIDGIKISATRGDGISELREHIKALVGYKDSSETLFTARRRHLTSLISARDAVQRGLDQLLQQKAGELLADELLQAQNALNEITGEFSADDLLGEIFSGFCIGK